MKGLRWGYLAEYEVEEDGEGNIYDKQLITAGSGAADYVLSVITAESHTPTWTSFPLGPDEGFQSLCSALSSGKLARRQGVEFRLSFRWKKSLKFRNEERQLGDHMTYVVQLSNGVLLTC